MATHMVDLNSLHLGQQLFKYCITGILILLPVGIVAAAIEIAAVLLERFGRRR